MNNQPLKPQRTLAPLSEEGRLVLTAPRELRVAAGETYVWDGLTRIGPRERRAISLDIHIEAGARGQMFRFFEVPVGSRLTILHSVHVGAGASWEGVIGVRGGGEVKVYRTLEVLGAGATATLACAALMSADAHISVADEVTVAATQAQVELCTKIVLKDRAQSEARGWLRLKANAQHSQAHERLDHLLLGEQTKATAIPELEVLVDEVKCSHAATTSRPGAGELAYLETRGLDGPAAESLLTQGFLAPALTGLSDQARAEAEQLLFA